MPLEDEPAWTILQCPNCAGVCKCDPGQLVAPACPTCGAALSFEPVMPDPNELLLDEEEEKHEIISQASSSPRPGFGSALISQLGSQQPAEPGLDPARIKRTTDEDLVSAAEERIRVKRSSKRVEKQLTSWDGNHDEEASNLENGHRRRLDRRVPAWLKQTRIAAIAAVPIALVCLTTYGLIASLKENEDEERAPEPPSEASTARAALTELESASLDRVESKETYRKALAVVEEFLAAPTWEARLAFVRDPERVRPLMEAFYARPENEDGAFAHRPLEREGKIVVHKSFMLFSVESDDLEQLPLAVERIDEDTYRVDWESFVGHNEVPWGEIKTRKPTEAFLLRARVRKREYYNYAFQEDGHTSWQLEDRAGDHRLFGYVDRKGPLNIELRSQTLGTRGAVYILLKVRYPENAPATDQVEITEVIGKGWIRPPDEGESAVGE